MALVCQTTTFESILDVIRERAASTNIRDTFLGNRRSTFLFIFQSSATTRASQPCHDHQVNRCAAFNVLAKPPPKVSLHAVRCPAPSVTEHARPRLPVFLQLPQPRDFFLDFVSLILKAIFSFPYLAQLSRRFHHLTAVLEGLRYICQLDGKPFITTTNQVSISIKRTRILNPSPNRSLKNGIKSFSST